MNFKTLIKTILFHLYLFFTVALHTSESKLVYNCQNGFSKFGSTCYFLSTTTATWQEAFFECQHLAKGSKLIVLSKELKNYNTRIFLKYKNNETNERWIGGIYDWSQNHWKWAKSGRQIQYNNFETIPHFNKEEEDHWQCITLNPNIDFKWTANSCLQKKYFLCESKPQPGCD